MASLRLIDGLELDLLAPGHGDLISDPAAKIAEYIEHRLARERALLAALEAGERSRTRLLDAAWSDVPGPMRPAAAMAMRAHLEKLEAEGRLDPAELVD
jgi:glyoxylase-like metal-dependent hydrolase (beta-lactamase superfamily II)